jgi:hypothetical protein
VWDEIVEGTVSLTKILRQTDPVFHKILGEARSGELSKESLSILETIQATKKWQDLEINHDK